MRIIVILALGAGAVWLLWRFLFGKNRVGPPVAGPDGVLHNPDGSIYTGWLTPGARRSGSTVIAPPSGDLTGADAVPPPAKTWSGQPVDPAFAPAPAPSGPPPPPPPPEVDPNYATGTATWGTPVPKGSGSILTGAGSF